MLSASDAADAATALAVLHLTEAVDDELATALWGVIGRPVVVLDTEDIPHQGRSVVLAGLRVPDYLARPLAGRALSELHTRLLAQHSGDPAWRQTLQAMGNVVAAATRRARRDLNSQLRGLTGRAGARR